MTDRELLELAAKAAGLEPFKAWGMTFVMGDGSPAKREWNPLTDDGDALRLAVNLGIRLEPMAGYCVAYTGSVCATQFSEIVDDDPYAAARRAIVRAAAGIGQSLPATSSASSS